MQFKLSGVTLSLRVLAILFLVIYLFPTAAMKPLHNGGVPLQVRLVIEPVLNFLRLETPIDDLFHLAIPAAADLVSEGGNQLVFVGITNSDESRPGVGLLAGYALIEVKLTGWDVVTIAANETIGRQEMPGFDQVTNSFGPTASSFFDSTLAPDATTTSRIIGKHFAVQIGIVPDRYVFVDKQALEILLPENQNKNWLFSGQYSENTSKRNKKVFGIGSELLRDLQTFETIWKIPNLISTGAIRFSKLDNPIADRVSPFNFDRKSVLLYRTNPAANKMDQYIDLDSFVCRDGSKTLLRWNLSYQPPAVVPSYVAGNSASQELAPPPNTAVTILFWHKGKAQSVTSDEFTGSYKGWSWIGKRVFISPFEELSGELELNSGEIDTFYDLAFPKKDLTPIQGRAITECVSSSA